MNTSELQEMAVGTEITIAGQADNRYWVLRVPTGWVYSDDNGGMCFVPEGY